MIINVYGSRGSIPVSGKDYLKYGGDTACLEIRSKNNELIIVDAGSGIRRLGNKLMKEEKKRINLIFTHAHWDHIMGFPFFKPIYFKGYEIIMAGCPFAQNTVKKMISKSMEPPTFPVRFDDVQAVICDNAICTKAFQIDSITITPILLSHPNQGIGYKFEEDGKVFVFLTDNELTYKHEGGLEYKDYLAFSMNADFLIHDAEYTSQEYKIKKTWGHSVYNDALNLAIEAGVKQFGLYHHNQERTDGEVDEIVADCRRLIAGNGSALECFGVARDMVFKL